MKECPFGYTIATEFALRGSEQCPLISANSRLRNTATEAASGAEQPQHMHDAIALLAEIDERIKIDGAIFRGSDFHGKITNAVVTQQHHA